MKYSLIRMIVGSSLLMGICACTHPQKKTEPLVTSHQTQWKPQVFASHPDWIGLNVDPEPVNQIRLQIEQIGKVPLKTRGEAHITLISPPEYAKIKSVLSLEDMEASIQQLDIQKTHWKPICIAQGSSNIDPKKITYFIVVESEGLLQMRRELLRLYMKKGGDPVNFDLLNYHPHITIGFTDRDLFETDGVIKDTSHCYFDLSTPEGDKITTWNQ